MLEINIRKTLNFIEITPKAGYVLTNWNNGDILDYYSTTMLVVPDGYDYSDYYTITEDEDAALMAELNDKIKELENI